MSLVIRLLVRVALVSVALVYMSPYVSGVSFQGDWLKALLASSIFNAAFFGLECLLGVIVFGINIGTLGLGVMITSSLKFVAAMLSPSLALWGTEKLIPHVLHIQSYFPGALVYGLMLGGLLWASVPDKKKS